MDSNSSPRRVGMVLETAFPPDARVEREATALIEAGYEVYLLCGHQSEPGAPAKEVYEGIQVLRVDPKSTRLPGVYRNLYTRFTGKEADWGMLIADFVTKQQIDVLHVHDLKLLKTALGVAKSHPEVRVVADLHENYPALVGRLTKLRKGEAKGLKKQRWWEAIERQSLPQANKVIVVVEEARERILQNPALSPKDVSIVRNVVDTRKFLSEDLPKLTPEEQALMQDRFILCYVGHINATHRGVHTVLAALPQLIQTIPNLLFVAVGSLREKYLHESLKPIIDAHQLQDYVYFTGFRDEAAFAPYIQCADIGLCPHLKTTLTDTTFPNKVFLYSLFEKPVVVSSCIPLERYIQETDSGLVYEADSPSDLARTLETLYHSPEKRRDYGEKGRRWVMERYCWDQEKAILLETYQSL